MAVQIKPKRTTTGGNVPSTSHLEAGEIAINLADKKLYVRDTSSNILELTTRTVSSLDDTTISSISNNQTLQYNSSTSKWENGDATVADGTITMAKVASAVWSSFNTDIVPDTDNIRSLGSATKQWKDVYIGPGTLHANGVPIPFHTGFNVERTDEEVAADFTIKNGYTATKSTTGKIKTGVTVTLETGSYMTVS